MRFEIRTPWVLATVFIFGSTAAFIGASYRVAWIEWLGYCILAPFVIQFLRLVLRPITERPPASELVIDDVPPLGWTENGWGCEPLIPGWEKTVPITFSCPDPDVRAAPSPAQIAAYHSIFDMADVIRRRVPVHLSHDNRICQRIARHLGTGTGDAPRIETLISLRAIEIENQPWDDQFELGIVYDFDCEWNRRSGFRIRCIGEHIFPASEV